jgi:ABC-type glycerol-3-phosphate transport system substrate-binding protein
VDGAGGLLDTLTTASAAAPLALPDLVALPRPVLETAALKGLLHPYDDFIDPPDDTDWFDYASRLERLQDSQFGLAFAGDALVLVYRTESVPEPPTDLASLLQAAGPLAFPAADPQALFTLALYQSAGGIILDDVGRPVLEKDALERIFSLYHQAAQLELFPFWLTQFQSDAQAWQAFLDGQASMVITWASRYLQTLPTGSAAAPIPTALGEDFTLGTGWVWALSGAHPDRQRAAAQLAAFLSEAAFLGEWTQATGYLPPRPSALTIWEDAEQEALIRRVSLSTHLYPSADVLPALATPLVEGTTNMLKLQGDPSSAAQAAVDSLLKP